MRLRVPDEGATVVHDVIRGDTRFEHVHLDDPVIARADGSVLYNFAVAIDDLDAEITHVVRGEDHLSNTPKQLLVLEAARAVGFGRQAPLPVYAHLPLLHGPDGKKLSKRHGAASVQELRDAGYLPEAVRNYLALLGWGAGRRRDGALDRAADRALHARARQPQPGALRRGQAELAERHLHPRAAARGADAAPRGVHRPRAASSRRCASARRRSTRSPTSCRSPGRCSTARSRTRRRASAGSGEDGRARSPTRATRSPSWTSFEQAAIEAALAAVIERRGVKPREVYQPLRVALTGGTVSPGIFESVALLGREETLARIDRALAARLSCTGAPSSQQIARGCR